MGRDMGDCVGVDLDSAYEAMVVDGEIAQQLRGEEDA